MLASASRIFPIVSEPNATWIDWLDGRELSGDPMAGKPNILVVEDEPLIQLALQDWLEKSGYNVALAADAAAAEALIDELGSSLAALITDIRLGDGKDGWCVAKYARTRSAQLPVIYMTGDSKADWEACGVEGSILFEKPILQSQLLSELDKRI